MAAHKSNLSLPELLKLVPELLAYYDDETGQPLTGATSLSWEALVVNLLSASFRPDGDAQGQVADAVRCVMDLGQSINETRHTLIVALKSMQEDKELKEAQAALADAKANGGIAWEEIKATLGLGGARYIVDGYDTRAKVCVDSRAPRRHLTPSQIKYGGSIGKLFGDGKFVCHHCALSYDLVAENAASVYLVNIIPYSQECHDCGILLVEGWDCQLYSKPADQWAVIRLNKDGLPEVDLYTLRDTPEDAEEVPRSNINVIGVVAVEGGV